MALEAVVVQQGLFGYNTIYNWSCEFGLPEKEEDYGSFHFLENQTENFQQPNCNSPSPTSVVPHMKQWVPNSSLEPPREEFEFPQLETSTRPKRRRSKSKKNKEEIENQRITHITVERNRRKQMNEYLSALRGLMPDSYVQKGDQASIIGGAINYVKDLEQRLQCLGGQKHMNKKFEDAAAASSSSTPFGEFFTHPQYSNGSGGGGCDNSLLVVADTASGRENDRWVIAKADIEVSMVESHANLKIRSKKRPKLLLKIVSGLQSLKLTVLHLNVTTVEQVVLYSFNVKVEDDSKLTTVDEIATALNLLLGRIHQEAVLLQNG